MAKDRFKYFRIEAREILDGLVQGLLDLEKTADPELISRLLRLAHTLKGAARIVGHRELTDLAHQIEDVLGPLRDAPEPQRLDSALALLDQMAVHVAEMEKPAGEPVPAVSSAARPEGVPVAVAATTTTAPAAAPIAASPALSVVPALPASAPSTPADPRGPTGGPPSLTIPPPGAAAPGKPGGRSRSPTSPAPAARSDAAAPRVDPSALDDVLTGLAEIHGQLRRLRGLDDLRQLPARIEQIERELREVRQDAERLRLLAAGTTFTALERTARDAAHALGKRVAFASSGGDVRIDAPVLGTLHGALVQLVRNAVAHGIETPAERIAAGKSPEGRVAITVALHGTRVAFTCHDDGRGVDLEAVRRAAVRRGLPADQAVALDRDQLLGMMLRGGLSTSAEVTTVSGRGIGLDVVRDAAHVLGGEVTVKTSATGTAITISAPTSLAALSGLVVSAGERIAALPLAAIRRVSRTAAMPVLRGPDGLAVAFDDVMVPFAPLAPLIGGTAGAPHRSTVIVDGGDGLAAVGVEAVIGVDDIVVRALPPGAPIEPIVRGLALDAEGLPRPILDPGLLAAAVRVLPISTVAGEARALPILVVDDSLTTRMLEQSILESAGYEVELASSAEEALIKVGSKSYGLCLVDVEMPGMDGFSFIATLRSQPQLADLPAILVTSLNRPEHLERGAAVGAQGYIVKGDFDQVRLLDMIRELVRKGGDAGGASA